MHDASHFDTSGKAEAACETACIALAPPYGRSWFFSPPNCVFFLFLMLGVFYWWLSLSLANALWLCLPIYDLGNGEALGCFFFLLWFFF